jgi:hypothetical protein
VISHIPECGVRLLGVQHEYYLKIEEAVQRRTAVVFWGLLLAVNRGYMYLVEHYESEKQPLPRREYCTLSISQAPAFYRQKT